MNPIRHSTYPCPDCGKQHGTLIEALGCCRIEVIEKDEWWECSACGIAHASSKLAEACCRPPEEAQSILDSTSPEEMEKRGQMRLIG